MKPLTIPIFIILMMLCSYSSTIDQNNEPIYENQNGLKISSEENSKIVIDSIDDLKLYVKNPNALGDSWDSAFILEDITFNYTGNEFYNPILTIENISAYLIIQNIVFDGNTDDINAMQSALSIINCSHFKISMIDIFDINYGIRIAESVDMTLDSSNINTLFTNIKIENSSLIIISNNDLNTKINTDYSNNIVISNNNITSLNYYIPKISFDNSNNITISNNSLVNQYYLNGGGIFLKNGKNSSISENFILNISDNSIQIESFESCEIRNNNISLCNKGIYLSDSRYIQIQDNYIKYYGNAFDFGDNISNDTIDISNNTLVKYELPDPNTPPSENDRKINGFVFPLFLLLMIGTFFLILRTRNTKKE